MTFSEVGGRGRDLYAHAAMGGPVLGVVSAGVSTSSDDLAFN